MPLHNWMNGQTTGVFYTWSHANQLFSIWYSWQGRQSTLVWSTWPLCRHFFWKVFCCCWWFLSLSTAPPLDQLFRLSEFLDNIEKQKCLSTIVPARQINTPVGLLRISGKVGRRQTCCPANAYERFKRRQLQTRATFNRTRATHKRQTIKVKDLN